MKLYNKLSIHCSLILHLVSGFKFKDLLSEPKYDILFSEYPLPQSDKLPILNYEKDIEHDLPEETENYLSQRTLMKSDNLEYLCETLSPREEPKLKTIDAKPHIIATEVGNALSQKLSNDCIHGTLNYWTYELCFRQHIKQYHIAQQGEKNPETAIFYLGKYSTQAEVQSKDQLPMVFKEDESGNYLSQVWEGGTKCDLTGKPRSTEIRYVCAQGPKPAFISINELETCVYQILIHVPLLCQHDVFKPQTNNNYSYITCYELVSDMEYQTRLTDLETQKTSPRNQIPGIEGKEGSDKKTSVIQDHLDDNDGPIPTLDTKLTPSDPLYLIDLAKWKKLLDHEYRKIQTKLIFVDPKSKNTQQLTLLQNLKRRKADCLAAYTELLILENKCRSSSDPPININSSKFTDKDRETLQYLETDLGKLPEFELKKAKLLLDTNVDLDATIQNIVQSFLNGDASIGDDADMSWLNIVDNTEKDNKENEEDEL